MNKISWWLSFFVVVSMFFGGCAAVRYDNSSLKGTYYVNTIEIRKETNAEKVRIVYCDSFGTLRFDGKGSIKGNGTRRCNGGSPVHDTGILKYNVNPDGSIIISEPGYPNLDVHGQITANGKIVLIDRTPTTDANKLIMHGIAVKVKK